jgi:hypothetical protein
MTTITCNKRHLFERCKQRGYTIDQVMPCVKSVDGENWTIDVTHWAYPHEKRWSKGGGVGTELKALLSAIGIKAKPNCSCNTKARVMDERGISWCESNKGVIVRWLQDEAKKRRLPFVNAAGHLLLGRAISRARKKGAK